MNPADGTASCRAGALERWRLVWMERARRLEIPIGVDEHADTLKIVLMYADDPVALRSAVIARVATSVDDVRRLEELWRSLPPPTGGGPDRELAIVEAASVPVVAPPLVEVRVGHPWWQRWQKLVWRLRAYAPSAIAAALVAAGLAATIVAADRVAGPASSTRSWRSQPLPTVSVKPLRPPAQPFRLRTLIPGSTVETFRRADLDQDGTDIGFLALGWVLATLAVRWWQAPRERRRATHEALERLDQACYDERARLAGGAISASLVHEVPAATPLTPAELADSALYLGQKSRAGGASDLDVETTLEQTIAAGALFSPAFVPRGTAPALVVVCVKHRGDHPALRGFLRCLDGWATQGLRIHRFSCDEAPDFVFPDQGGPGLSFADLTAQFAGDTLTLFAEELLVVGKTRRPRAWVASVGEWARCVWLDPVPRGSGASVPEELAARGLKRFPWTGEGVRAWSIWCGGGRELPRTAPEPDLPALDEKRAEALRRWLVACVLVPDATWDQIEAFRTCREIPEIGAAFPHPWQCRYLIAALHARGIRDPVAGSGAMLEVEPSVIDDILFEERTRHGAAVEARARAVLRRQLETFQPSDAWGELQRDVKLLSHQIVLEPARLEELIARFLAGPARDEVISLVRQEMARQSGGAVGPAGSFGEEQRQAFEASIEGTDRIRISDLVVASREEWGRSAIGGMVVLAAVIALAYAAVGARLRDSVVEEVRVPTMYSLEPAP